MASPKKDKFSKEDVRLARFAKALSHPARILILRNLASCETSFFWEISREVPLADSTVSQHLSELKNAGLITDRLDPPRIEYCINYENWKTARKWLKEFAKTEVSKKDKNRTGVS